MTSINKEWEEIYPDIKNLSMREVYRNREGTDEGFFHIYALDIFAMKTIV